MITYIVVDTGYLLELFRIPKHFKEEDAKQIKKKLEFSIENNHRLYIPTPVLFELANHIAHVDDGSMRRQLVNKFSKVVNDCIDDNVIHYNIIPFSNSPVIKALSNNLEEFIQRFADEFVQQKLGLTDSSVLLEAESLKQTYPYHRVHIWTTDAPLKPYEPDTEPNPFIGTRK